MNIRVACVSCPNIKCFLLYNNIVKKKKMKNYGLYFIHIRRHKDKDNES